MVHRVLANFSISPANSAGKNLAIAELHTVVAVLVLRFDIQFAEGYDVGRYEERIEDTCLITRTVLIKQLLYLLVENGRKDKYSRMKISTSCHSTKERTERKYTGLLASAGKCRNKRQTDAHLPVHSGASVVKTEKKSACDQKVL